MVQQEIIGAPQVVTDLFDDMIPFAELIEVNENALKLRNAYLEAKIVTAKYSEDALHVALATVAECKLLVKLEL